MYRNRARNRCDFHRDGTDNRPPGDETCLPVRLPVKAPSVQPWSEFQHVRTIRGGTRDRAKSMLHRSGPRRNHHDDHRHGRCTKNRFPHDTAPGNRQAHDESHTQRRNASAWLPVSDNEKMHETYGKSTGAGRKGVKSVRAGNRQKLSN